MNYVQAGDLDQKRGSSRNATGDQLEIGERGEEGRTLAMVVAPSPARFEAEGCEEAGQPGIRLRRAGRLDEG